MSRVILTLLLVLTIAFSPPLSANEHSARKALTTNVYSPNFGLLTLKYEQQLSIKQTLNINLNSWNWKSGDKEGSGFGYGIGYRYYFYRPLEGYYYGLGINIVDMVATNEKGTSSEVAERGTIFYPQFEGGYSILFPKGIRMDFGFRSYFGIGQLRDTDYPFFGLHIIPSISAGYRF